MPFPTPSNTGQSYTDPNTGRSWTLVQLTPPVWGVNKNATLSVGNGISAAGGMSLTGGLTAYGTINFKNELIAPQFQSSSLAVSQSGFTASFIHIPFAVHNGNVDGERPFLQAHAYVNSPEGVTLYRWGANGYLGRDYGWGIYDNDLFGFYSPYINAIVPPPQAQGLSAGKIPVKILNFSAHDDATGEFILLNDRSLTAWGSIKIQGLTAFYGTSTQFIDIAVGASAPHPIGPNASTFRMLGGWWLGLMANGRLTGNSWPDSTGFRNTDTTAPATLANPIFTTMPQSLRSTSTTGLTAKAILGGDDAYCYALMADGSLTAWGATAFLLGGSGGAGTWTSGGTGGILSNFPSGITFENFVVKRAKRTIGFARKADGDIVCFGYTGTVGTLSRSLSGFPDYRNIFTRSRSGDEQIIKIEYTELESINNASLGVRGVFASGPTFAYFYDRPFTTNPEGNSEEIALVVGLMKNGSLTGGYFTVNDTSTSIYGGNGIDYPSVGAKSAFYSGATFSDFVAGRHLILGKLADGSLRAFGPTFGSDDTFQQQTILPTSFYAGLQTTTRVGNILNITKADIGSASDPYTSDILLDVRGQVVASQYTVVSDESLKTDISDKNVGDGIISYWKDDLLSSISPKEFRYFGNDSGRSSIGYLAADLETANKKYTTPINPIDINSTTPPNSENDTTAPYSAISLNALMVGTIESLRELDTEMSRIWLTESPPYPSKIKNGDLWYYSGENRLYVRRNNVWIQVN